jgi:glutamate/aspartate transport system substrate-binding protein
MNEARKATKMLLVLLGWMSFATAALAQDSAGVEVLTGTLKKVRANGAITLGFRDASIPFSYLGPGRKPIGYSIDLCLAIVEEVKAELGIDAIAVKYLPVNPQTRIAMVVDGAIDLECGSTTNNIERQKQVAFSPIFFVSGTKVMVKRGSKYRSYRDLKGRPVAVTEGTTNEAAINAVNSKEGLGMKVVAFRDHDQAFAALEAGKVDAWASDDVLLYAQAAESANPRGYSVLDDYISYDPYGLMFRKNDPAFAALVRRTFEELAQSRQLSRLYHQWFQHKLPSGRTLGLAMSPQLESIFEALGQPTGTE